MVGEAIAHPSILERLFAVRTDQGSHFRHGLEPQVVPIAQTHIDAARLRFLFPNHQNIRYLGQLRLAHLEAQLLVARIGRHADPQSFQLLAGLERGFVVGIGDRQDPGLFGRQPGGHGAGVLLDEHTDEALQRAHDGPVHHDRAMTFAVLAHIGQVETFRQGEVHLDGGALPFTTDAVQQAHVDLGAVEGAVALVDLVGHAGLLHGLDQGIGRQFPGFVGPDAVLGTGGDAHLVVEAEQVHQVADQVDDTEDLAFQLFGRAQDVGIVLGELAHTQQAVQGAALFVAVHHAQLEVALGQVTVAAQIVAVDQHVRDAVHGLDAVLIVLDLGEIHVLAVMVVVTGALPGLHAQQLRALHQVVVALEVLAAPEVFQDGAHQHALGQPEDHARGHVFMEGEEAQFAAQLAVVAALGFFQLLQIGVEGLLVGKGGAVQTGEHGVLFVAAPVGAGSGKDLAGPGKAGVRHVGAAAQVGEIAAGVQGDRVALDAFDDLHLEVLAHLAELLDGVGLAHGGAHEGQAFAGDTLHLCLDGREVLAGEGLFHVEVVVEAVLHSGTDGHLGRGIKLFHRGGHDMGRGMADHAQAFGRIGVHGSDVGTLGGHGGGKVAQSLRAPCGHARSHHGFEFFAAQRFLQNSGHITLFGGVHHLSFHADIHVYTPSGALSGVWYKKRNGEAEKPPHLQKTCCFHAAIWRAPPLSPRAHALIILFGRNEQT